MEKKLGKSVITKLENVKVAEKPEKIMFFNKGLLVNRLDF